MFADSRNHTLLTCNRTKSFSLLHAPKPPSDGFSEKSVMTLLQVNQIVWLF